MVNLTVNDNGTAIQGLSCNTRGLLDVHQRIIISAFHIPLSITTFLGTSKAVVPSSIIKAFVWLPRSHRSRRGPHCTPPSCYLSDVSRKFQVLLLCLGPL